MYKLYIFSSVPVESRTHWPHISPIFCFVWHIQPNMGLLSWSL